MNNVICNSKSLFDTNNGGHLIKLSELVQKALASTQVDDKNLEESFIETLSEFIKGNETFEIQYDSDKKDTFDKAYEGLLNSIMNILHSLSRKKDKEKYQKMSAENLQMAFINVALPTFGIKKSNISAHTKNWDIETSIFGKDDTMLVSYKDSRNDIFATSEGSARFAYLTFVQQVREAAFANFEKGILVADEATLNKSLNDYKQQLFEQVVSYLNKQGDDFDTSIWNDSGIPKYENYSKVLSKMHEVIKGNQEENPDLLDNSYYDKLDGESSDYFDAVVSYYKLAYFDDILQESLGLTISSINGLRNTIQSRSIQKYRWSDTETGHKVKNWNEDGDARSAIDNTSKLTKLILNTIPLKGYTSSTGANFNIVGPVKFTQTITKLLTSVATISGELSLGEDSRLPEHKLYDYVLRFHDNPTYYASKIFELICDPENISSQKTKGISIKEMLKSKLGFNDVEIAVLDSVYDYIFAFYNNKTNYQQEYKDYKYKSAKSLEINNALKGGNQGKYSIVDDIAGLMDDVMDLTYIETVYDSNGQVEINARRKNNSRDQEEKLVSKINSDVFFSPISRYETIVKNQNVQIQEDSSGVIALTLDGENYVINNTNGIFAIYNKDTKEDNLLKSLTKIAVNYLNVDSLSNKDNKSKIIKGDGEYKKVHDLLRFIDSNLRLDTKLLSYDGLEYLKIIASIDSSNGNMEPFAKTLKEFLFYATKAFYISKYKSEQAKTGDSNTSIYEYIKNHNSKANEYFSDSSHNDWIINNNGVKQIKIIKSGINDSWLGKLVTAQMITSGDVFSSVSKNLEGNNDANYSTSFLGGNLQYYIAKYKINADRLKKIIVSTKANIEEKLKENPDDESLKMQLSNLNFALSETATEKLFFSQGNNAHMIKGTIVNSGVKNQRGDTKLIKSMNSGELFYQDIVHNFFGRLCNPGKNGKHNDVLIQPTTYSDKTKFIQYIINMSKTVKCQDGGTRALKNLRVEDIIELFKTSIGSAYKTTYQNVINLYKRILVGEHITEDADSEIITENSFNTASELNTYLAQIPVSRLIKLAQSKGEVLLEDTHYREFKNKNGVTCAKFNQDLQFNAEYLYKDDNIKTFLKEQENQFIKDLEASGINLYVSDVEDSDTLDVAKTIRESNYIMAQAIKEFYPQEDEQTAFYYKWVKNGKLLIEKDGELNPLLQKYFYLNSFLSNNLRLALTGSEIAHPEKFKLSYGNDSKISALKGLAYEWAKVAGGENFNSTLDDYMDSLENYSRCLNPIKGTDNVIYTDLEVNKASVRNKFGDKFIFFDQDNSLTYEQKLAAYADIKKQAKDENKTLIVLDPSIKEDIDEDIFGNEAFAKNSQTPDLTFMDCLLLGEAVTNNKGKWEFNSGNLMEWLKSSTLKPIAISILTQMENNAQGTQLKRNVIIPGTLHYAHLGTLDGIPAKTKVAILKDLKAPVWTFLSDKDGSKQAAVDAHDGSALQNPIWTILENNALGSQKVGQDMKPIWHSMNEDSMSASLVKFAVFNISNQRMQDTLNSEISLENIMKKMTNLQWQNADGSWNTKVQSQEKAIDLTRLSEKGKNEKNMEKHMNPDGDGSAYFSKYILKGRELKYQDAEGRYWRITNFGRTKDGIYYTDEVEYDSLNGILTNLKHRHYHIFDSNSRQNSIRIPFDVKPDNNNKPTQFPPTNLPKLEKGQHTINSIYELWKSLGGYTTVSYNGTLFETNEMSSQIAAEFVNNCTFRKTNGDRTDLTTHSYEQPLKEMMIGYVANVSAVKNGRGNVNSSDAWKNDEALTYMELDNAGFGIQMDADHEAVDSTMTEFSQVITALEAGGRTHNITKFVYKALGQIARNAYKTELDIVAEYLNSENPARALNEIYDIIGRVILNAATGQSGRADLTDKIIERIEKQFNKHLGNHRADLFKIPFSDPNVFSQILSTFIGNVNATAVKRKYSGSGCVMVPGYNMMQIYKDPSTGNTYKFGDLYDKIIHNEELKTLYYTDTGDIRDTQLQTVRKYLEAKQKQEKEVTDIEAFIPSDVIDVYDETTGESVIDYNNKDLVEAIKLDTFDKYYTLICDKDAWLQKYFPEKTNLKFRQNVVLPRDLAPARILWKYKDNLGEMHTTNIFASSFYKDKCEYDEKSGNYKFKGSVDKHLVQKQLDLIEQGKFLLDGEEKTIIPNSLVNEAAEIIISDIFRNKFETNGKSLAKIQEQGAKAFRLQPLPKSSSDVYDLVFRGADGKNTYITFDKIDSGDNKKVRFKAFKGSQLKRVKDTYQGSTSYKVYLVDSYGKPKMEVGRDVARPEYRYDDKKFVTKDGKILPTQGRFYTQRVTDASGQAKTVVYERIFFIEQYDAFVQEQFGDDADQTFQNVVPLYRINKGRINQVFEEGAAEVHKYRFIAKLIDEIGKQDNYIGLEFSDNLSVSSVLNIRNSIGFVNCLGKEFNETQQKIKSVLDKVSITKGENNKFDYNQKAEFDPTEINKAIRSYYKTLAQARYVSWQQSRYFTVARIPAQSHQSFMQMKAVAYTGSEKNVCHVSHFQTFLQGSDYDIDKAYVMACEIGQDGRYVKYSDLFDYSSLDTLKASLTLPIPESFKITAEGVKNKRTNLQNKSYYKEDSDNTGTKEKEDVFQNYDGDLEYNMYDDINELSRLNAQTEDINIQKANQLRTVSKILRNVYNLLDQHKENGINFILSGEEADKYSEIFETLVNDIYVHNSTQLGSKVLDSAYKNYVSANIQNVIQNPRNMITAYTPIAMDDIRDSSNKSEKGNAVKYMSLYNPATKWLMQQQNMTGKDVIGITAVGEKVYFNSLFHWNEILQNGDPDKIKNLRFRQTFDRIQDRNSGTPTSIEVKTLAGVNFEKAEKYASSFISTASKISHLLNTEKYESLKTEEPKFIVSQAKQYIDSGETLTEQQQLYVDLYNDIQKFDEIKTLLETRIEPDQLISQLLSAATDNAKELILDKINCDSNFAKCYLYLIMMGFDIKDITSFMISPAVSNVVNLFKYNLFDPYVNNLNLSKAIALAKGSIIPDQFIHGMSYPDYDASEYEKPTPYVDILATSIRNNSEVQDVINTAISNEQEEEDLSEEDDKKSKLSKMKANKLVALYIKQRLLNGEDDIKPLLDVIRIPHSKSVNLSFIRYAEYVEYIFNKIKKTIDSIQTASESTREDAINTYYADLDEFSKVEKLATEASNTGKFLGLNQGLPTSKTDLLKLTKTIHDTFTTTERNYLGYLTYQSFGPYKLDYEGNIKVDKNGKKVENKKAVSNFESLKQKVIDNNVIDEDAPDGYVTKEEIEAILQDAIYFGVMGNFSFKDWITNKTLKVGDEKTIAGISYKPSQDISYQDFVIKYYNIIKGSFNMFYELSELPQFKELENLLQMEYVVDNEISVRGKLSNIAMEDLTEHGVFLNQKKIERLNSYISDLIVLDFFERNPYTLNVSGNNYKFVNGELKYDLHDFNIDLSTYDGRAAFKYLMENEIVPKLREEGKWGDYEIAVDDAFLNSLGVQFDKYGSSSLVSDINLLDPNNTPGNSIKYQKYINSLIKMSRIKPDGSKLSLADLFILYNLIVNKNMYGKDRLTGLFRAFVHNVHGTVYDTYFQYIGQSDINKINQERLDEIGYSLDDAQIAIATRYSKNYLYTAKEKYVITPNSYGQYVPHRRMFGDYVEEISYPGQKFGEPLPIQKSAFLKQYYSLLYTNRLQQIQMYDYLFTDQSSLDNIQADKLFISIDMLVKNGIIKTYKICNEIV